ncbi:glutamate-cysteine ligase family protein [Ktedonospora formicarum]|uniref:Glutamate--cysteine ligase n=1 Tax=Ktedonospora formicarum TaxID=2778364 RepID=A0A8J3ICD6_9CHLR|nr:glutamate-cysteine ligase family protein [Ktedonospora formicarum]GHO49519.1 hypothetical protein KSX_76820 [Ktedonospora formicarum]
MFTFGIEHEIAFLDHMGQFADFRSLDFNDLAALIESLPLYHGDYPRLRVGRTGIRRKRWYIEGFDRHDEQGNVNGFLPKGTEIRTTPCASIKEAIEELSASFESLRVVATEAGFTPVLTSFHPYRSEVEPLVPFNAYERATLQRSAGERAALLALLTFGPDLNIAYQGLSEEAALDVGMKFMYYSPYILPFSYSSPFWCGEPWNGFSVRTAQRTGRRAIVNVFLSPDSRLRERFPGIIKSARIPGEVGRIEFKACDSCDQFSLYAGLLALLKGLLIDTTLPGRALEPDIALHQHSARFGLDNATIAAGSRLVVDAAQRALDTDADALYLAPLLAMLHHYEPPARRLLASFSANGSIEAALRQTYQR